MVGSFYHEGPPDQNTDDELNRFQHLWGTKLNIISTTISMFVSRDSFCYWGHEECKKQRYLLRNSMMVKGEESTVVVVATQYRPPCLMWTK